MCANKVTEIRLIKQYRKNVLAVIVDSDKNILVGERSDRPGIWQMPQGGIDEGESAEQALMRELKEEIGTDKARILEKLDHKITYDFPEELAGDIMKKYRGQIQDWFLLELEEDAVPDLSKSLGEFVALDWKNPDSILCGIVEWKKKAYQQGLEAFNLLGR